jgi:DNA (cytosine-5)-methyltransferase 1
VTTNSAPTSTGHSFVSLFSGAGGLDLGLEESGWSCLAQIDMDHDSVLTLRRTAERQRHSSVKIIEAQIEDVEPALLRTDLGLERGELELLAGGPPCQPFTTHGLRKALSDDRASGVWPSYLEFVAEFQPQVLLIENVDGLLSAALSHRRMSERSAAFPALRLDERKGSFLYWLLRELTKLDYTVTWGLVEAADFGVAQRRQRTILIGTRDGVPCTLPAATHGTADGLPMRTLRDALRGLDDLGEVQPLSERKKRVYEQIPAGGNWRALPESVRASTMGRAHLATGGKSGWWRRLAWEQPAPTILGMPDHSSTALVHPDEVRCLSTRECAALQGFPSDMEFAGTSRSIYQQIGNAVPSAVGVAIGRRLLEHIAGEQFDVPPAPLPRKTSGNRRIGVHGWVSPGSLVHLNAPVRDDHVWAVTRTLDFRGAESVAK